MICLTCKERSRKHVAWRQRSRELGLESGDPLARGKFSASPICKTGRAREASQKVSSSVSGHGSAVSGTDCLVGLEG